MISTPLARRLREAGLRWAPVSGDAFQVDEPEFEGDVFTVSEMTIEPHDHPHGTILGFNGTTEWALDSVDLDDVVWLPREDQLRDMLGPAFRRLTRTDSGGGFAGADAGSTDPTPAPTGAGYRVDARIDGDERSFDSEDAAESYALALLALLRSLD